MTHLVVTLPLKIESTANKREHWSRRAARASAQRGAANFHLTHEAGWKPPAPPLTVTLTRIAPKALDSDNNVAGFKHVRDGVADWLGVNDNDKRITWLYAQERGAPKHYAARIEVKA